MSKIGKGIVRKIKTTKADPATGETTEILSRKWYVEIRVDGKNYRCPGYPEKRPTETLRNRLEKHLMDLAEQNGGRLDIRSLTDIKDAMDKSKEGDSMAELVTAFEKALLDKGTAAESVKTKIQRVNAFVNGCSWKRPADIRESDVLSQAAKLRKAQKLAKRTVNHYLVALKHFASWLKRDKRTDVDHLDSLEITKVDDADLVHVRRVLSPNEFAKLLETTRTNKVSFKISGPDRMILYALASCTGFRARELASMTPASLSLLAEVPTATVVKTKNGKTANNPLNQELVALLLPWLKERDPDKPLWTGKTWFEQAAAMLRTDLKVAGIQYKDKAGHPFDFHALRAMFATNLALAGVHPAVAQVLMRHSKIDLTMNVYTKLGLTPKAEAVNKLPSLGSSLWHSLGQVGSHRV